MLGPSWAYVRPRTRCSFLGLVSRPRRKNSIFGSCRGRVGLLYDLGWPMLCSWGPCWGHVEHMFGQEHRCPKRNTPSPCLGSRAYIGLMLVDVGTYLRVLPSVAVYFCFYSPSSVLLKVLTTSLRCPPWCWMVCPPFRGLVSPCLPACVPLLDCVSAFSRSCLLLSPIVTPHACLCSMLWPPSQGLVSQLVPRLVPAWMVCPPSRALVSLVSQLDSQLVSCRLSFSLSCFVWMVCPTCFVSNAWLPTCLPGCLPASLPFVSMVRPPSWTLGYLVSQPVPHLASQLVSMVRPACLRGLASLVSQLVRHLGSAGLSPGIPACLPACAPPCLLACLSSLSPSFLLLVSQLVSQLVCELVFLLAFLCRMVCPPSQGLVTLVSQLVSQLVSAHLPACLPSLSPSLSPSPSPDRFPACLPSCFPSVELCVHLPESLSPSCLQLASQLVSQLISPLVSQLVFLLFPFVGWCVHLREPLSPLSSSLSPSLPPNLSPSLFPFVGWCACLPTSPPACLPASSRLSLSCFPLRQVVSFCIFSWYFANVECALLVWSCSPAWKLWAPELKMMSSFAFTL